MPLGMEVGLGPGDFVFHEDPAPPPQRSTPPIVGPYPLQPNGCIDQDATWYGCRPQPRALCVRWRHSPPPQKGGGAPTPNFRPMFIVAERLDA